MEPMKSAILIGSIALCITGLSLVNEAQPVTSSIPPVQPKQKVEFLDLGPKVEDYGIVLSDDSKYTDRKAQAQALRNKLRAQVASGNMTIDSAGVVFTEFLVNKIIPHWYGTDWDFNGYTDVPNQGLIACGYFISTTMKHMGVNINRYRLAQQAALNGAKSIVDDYSKLKWYKKVEELYVLKEGLYKCGLDNHVGYLLKRKGELFFLHSSYVGEAKVTCEFARESPALNSSNNYLITPITSNHYFIRKWLYNERFTVVTGK